MENILIIQHKNKYGYTTLQLKINYTEKTYKKGHFKIGADKTYKIKKDFINTIEQLKRCGFKEI